MVKGAEIDLRTSADEFPKLIEAYTADLEREEISDDVIRHVATMVRCVRGALDKTATGVQRKYGTANTKPYFPLIGNPTDFDDALNGQFPGLRQSQPAVADAFRSCQPFNGEFEALGYLPALYRVNQHQDFALQERKEGIYMQITWGGMVLMTAGPHGMTIGGPPPPGALVLNAQMVGDRNNINVINGKAVQWSFVGPSVPVLHALVGIQDQGFLAVDRVSSAASL